MAVKNPAFNGNKAFSPDATAAELQALYDAPSANRAPEKALTYEATIAKSFISFAVLILGAVGGWTITTANPALGMGIVTFAAIGGFVLAMVNIFKKEPVPALILAYALLEGFLLGAISLIFDAQWSGIVAQAVIATIVVVGVTLALFASGKIRASARATKIFLIGIVAYVVFSLVSLIMSMFGATTGQFGLNSVEVFGIPLGLLIGPIVILLAAYSLVLDFDMIQRGVNNKAPAKFAWTGAFSIMVTVVWLYMQILQMLALSRN
jgi:uncharacterized YccA/Bax inhibitor family protein